MDFIFTPAVYAACTGMGVGAWAGAKGANAFSFYKQAQKKANDKYDLVVTIDSLVKLPSPGWQITYPVYESIQQTQKAGNKSGLLSWFSSSKQGSSVDEEEGSHSSSELVPVSATTIETSIKEPLPSKKAAVTAVLGLYNRGKSYLLARVFGLNLESSYFSHTEGFSAVLSRSAITETLVGLDTKGSQKPVIGGTKEAITDAEATERFLQCLAFELSDVVIVVVNRLTRDDQSYILQLKDMREKSIRTKKPELIVVHNLTHVRSLQHMDQIIEEEVVKCCETELAVKDNPYWSEADGTRHVVLGMDESDPTSEAGKVYNKRTVSLLQSWLAATASTSLRSVNLVERIINFTNERVGNFLTKQIKVVGQQHPDGRYSSIVMTPDSKINVSEIGYQDMRFNLVGIIERPTSEGGGGGSNLINKAKVVSDNDFFYISIDCPGFREEDIEAAIVDEKTVHITGTRPIDRKLPRESTLVKTDFDPNEPEKIDWTCTLPGAIRMEDPDEYMILDGVFYMRCRRRGTIIKVGRKKPIEIALMS